jgi:DNA-binding response OmpR family regulator
LLSLEHAPIFIVEDEAFVALDLALSVEEAGGTVIGPAASLEEAMDLLRYPISGAILDVHLPDGNIGPVLHELMRRGVPVIVQTGGGLPPDLKARYPQLLVLPKPNDSSGLVKQLAVRMNR